MSWSRIPGQPRDPETWVGGEVKREFQILKPSDILRHRPASKTTHTSSRSWSPRCAGLQPRRAALSPVCRHTRDHQASGCTPGAHTWITKRKGGGILQALEICCPNTDMLPFAKEDGEGMCPRSSSWGPSSLPGNEGCRGRNGRRPGLLLGSDILTRSFSVPLQFPIPDSQGGWGWARGRGPFPMCSVLSERAMVNPRRPETVISSGLPVSTGHAPPDPPLC